MRPRLTALLLAVLAVVTPGTAARAQEPGAPPFEVIPRPARDHQPHHLVWLAALAGAGLVAGSFPLASEADRRYAAYLAETDVGRIEARYKATTRMDRLASGTLLAGEGLLATAVWLRFLRPRHEGPRVTYLVAPDRCAVSLRF
jgi:hypothetical protein